MDNVIDLSDEEIEEILPQPPPKKVQVVAPPLSAPSVSEPSQISVPQIIAKDLRKDKGPGSDNSGLFCGSAESDQHVEPLFDDSEKYKVCVDFFFNFVFSYGLKDFFYFVFQDFGK